MSPNDGTKSLLDHQALLDRPEMEIPRICKIDVLGLEGDLVDHASLFAWAVAMYEKSKAEEARLRNDYDYEKYSVFNQLISDDKKLAIGKAEKMAETELSVRRISQRVADCQYRTSVYRALMNALEHRRDMLVQIAARQRAERNLTTH